MLNPFPIFLMKLYGPQGDKICSFDGAQKIVLAKAFAAEHEVKVKVDDSFRGIELSIGRVVDNGRQRLYLTVTYGVLNSVPEELPVIHNYTITPEAQTYDDEIMDKFCNQWAVGLDAPEIIKKRDKIVGRGFIECLDYVGGKVLHEANFCFLPTQLIREGDYVMRNGPTVIHRTGKVRDLGGNEAAQRIMKKNRWDPKLRRLS